MKRMTYILLLILLAASAALYVRLAPSDPAKWNVTLDTTTPAQSGPCLDQIVTMPNGAHATCLLTSTPADTLTRLNTTALATPRTTLLAGSPDQGLMTWITRSNLMGFPDYITAQTQTTPQGTRLDILSRQRFGSRDMGVNTARLKLWLAPL